MTLDTGVRDEDTSESLINAARRRMSDSASAIRNPEIMTKALEQTETDIASASSAFSVNQKSDFYKFYKYTDTLLTQCVILAAFLDYAETVGKTRGSALYYSPDGSLRQGLSEMFRLKVAREAAKDKIQTVTQTDGKISCTWRPVRPIPETDGFFENVWRSFRENGNVY